MNILKDFTSQTSRKIDYSRLYVEKNKIVTNTKRYHYKYRRYKNDWKWISRKKKIYQKAKERANKIVSKYSQKEYEGFLDGEPWAKELRQDSKRVISELEELDKEYKK